MITKNEEFKLKKCLESVKDIVNEIIIVDTGSTDKTKDIALEFGAKIYDYKWDNNFANARNYSISKSSGDWNLILDADEFIINIDLDSVYKFMDSKYKTIGQIKIVNLFEQDGEIRKSNSFISRLAPKGVYFNGSIHEQLDCSYPRKRVDIELEHDGYLNTNKFDRNIALILNELKENSNDSYLLYQAAKTYYSNKMYKEASPYFDAFYTNFNVDTDAFVKDGLILYLYNIIKANELEKGLKIINDNFDMMNKYCDFYFVCGVFFTELVAFNPEKYMCYFDNIELSYLNALQLGESNDSDSVEGTGSYLAAFNLGVFYELIGNSDKALEYCKLSYDYNYIPSLNILNSLNS
jgi:glycosyltransferase involved in cell wall biosynthesis